MRISIAVSLLLAAAAAPRFDAWKIIGPGGGGAQFYPAVSPHTDRTVLVACDMTGSYISHDGGDSWRMFNLRGVSRFFAFDPKNADLIYSGANALWRSRDRGRTWSMLYPQGVTGVSMGNDHADEAILIANTRAPRPRAMAVHPKEPNKLYLAVQDGSATLLITSVDGGASWKQSGDIGPGARKLYVNDSGSLRVIGDSAVAVMRDGAWKAGTMLADIQDASGGWAPDGRFVAYAVTRAGGFVTEDDGATWREFSLPGKGARLRAIATGLNAPDVAYVSYSNLDGQFFGVAKTPDRGRTWELAWKESRAAQAGNIHYGWIEERFGSGWASNPLNLGVSPRNPDLAFGTDYGRTMRTTDGGKTWRALYTRREGEGWTSTGLDVTTAYGVHFDPFDAKRLFITYTDIGAFRSEDGGQSWISATQGIERPWTNTTYWMEFDPKVRGRVWAVFSGTHDLPRPKMWRTIEPSSYRGGAGISEDGGRSWRMIKDAGMPETAATHIVLDPSSAVDSRTLFVAAYGRGVYKSVDGGKSWVLKNEGIAGKEPFAWRLVMNGRRLYLVVARRNEDGSMGNAGDGSLYISDDGAEHWREIPLPAGVNGPNGLAVDPRNPKRLFLAAWSRRGNERKMGGGIFQSDDAGATWRPIFEDDQHVYDVTIDPRDPRVMYACGFESSAWRSSDGGVTWKRLRGYNFKWGHRVIPDPHTAGKVYITTFGGSVWWGPSAGDPRAAEDGVELLR